MREPLLQLGVECHYPARGDLCVCLSGGGFRAAAFHLGVLKWLQHVGALPHVGEVRAVSGGALVAGWMARKGDLLFRPPGATDERFEHEFAAPLRDFLARDIRTGPIFSTIGVNLIKKGPRVRRVARHLQEFLGRGHVERIRGVDFRLSAFDIDSEHSVELDPTQGDLAEQVVASAAFPPLIGPVSIGGRRLIDGGVASNLGVSGETLQSWRCVVLSDASRVSPRWLRWRGLPISVRLMALLRDGANRATRNYVAATNSDHCLATVVPLSVTDWYRMGAVDDPVLTFTRASRFRTDLAGFSPRMITELERAGHATAEILVGDAFEKWAARVAAGEAQLRPNSAQLMCALNAHGGFSAP